VGKKIFGNTSLKSGKHAAGSEYSENVTLPWSEDYHIMQSLVTSLTKVLPTSDLITQKMVGDIKFYGAYEHLEIQIY
jgi:hypothetical protein